MKFNQWTLALASVGAIALPASADEALHPVQSLVQSTTISGYVDTSAIVLFNSGSGTQLYGRTFDTSSKQNQFNLDVVSLALEKPLDEGQWSAGYRVQMWMGPDASTLNSLSSTTIGNGGSSSDFALKNAYVALRAPVGNGLDFKIGVWDTIIGYEVADSPLNPTFSRSFGFYIEPIIHTGVLASYRVSSAISLSGGIANRADVNNINAANYSSPTTLSYMGSVTLTAPESMGFLKGATLSGGIVDAGTTSASLVYTPGIPPAISPRGYEANPLNYYVGATLPTPITGVTVGAAYDYRDNGMYDGSYESALAGYVSWQASEKLKLNGRVDWAKGNQGAYGVPVNFTDLNAQPELLSITGVLDYKLWANAITRIEARWDRSLNDQNIYNGYNDAEVFSIALNVIYSF